MADRTDFERADRPSTAQPAPTPNDRQSVHAVAVRALIDEHGGPWTARLVKLMMERDEFGFRKYGTRLQAHNGRDPLTDALEEVLDGLAYITQAAVEDSGTAARITLWTELFCDLADVAERLLEVREIVR